MRQLSYEFIYVNPKYDKRKDVENKIKQLLMSPTFTQLIDSHEKNGYWYAKCESVKVDDVHEKSQLKIDISFVARPFFVVDSDVATDLWDDLWDQDIYEQDLSFDVIYRRRIKLWNGYDRSITPIITTSDEGMSIELLGQIFDLEKGRNEFFDFNLLKGVNDLIVKGKGTIDFRLIGEVMY